MDTPYPNYIQHEGLALALEWQTDAVVLRLDRDGLKLDVTPLPVVTLTLRNCRNLPPLPEEMRNHPSLMLYILIERVLNEGCHIEMELDYGRVEVAFQCEEATETLSEYTAEDLRLKCRALATSYENTLDQELKTRRSYRAFYEEIQREVHSQLDRAERRWAFFEISDPRKTAFTQGQIKAYEHIRTVTTQFLERPPHF